MFYCYEAFPYALVQQWTVPHAVFSTALNFYNMHYCICMLVLVRYPVNVFRGILYLCH